MLVALGGKVCNVEGIFSDKEVSHPETLQMPKDLDFLSTVSNHKNVNLSSSLTSMKLLLRLCLMMQTAINPVLLIMKKSWMQVAHLGKLSKTMASRILQARMETDPNPTWPSGRGAKDIQIDH